MKKYSYYLIYLVICSYAFMFSIQNGNCQANFIGTWEGMLMNDFRTLIHFNNNTKNVFEGNIKVFAGDNPIQDDPLENILLANDKLTFFIPAKATWFEGRFNPLFTELAGQFIFPDSSKHAILLKRALTKSNTAEKFSTLKEKKFEVEKLHSDLLLLYTNLKEQHPQLYSFSSKDALDLLVEKTLNEINEPLTLEEFYFHTAKLTNAVHCSHTGVKLPSTYQNLAKDFGNYFPLNLFFDNGKAFYISGLSDGQSELSPGTEVTSINEKPINEIIVQAFNLIPAEGCNTTTKYNKLNRSFNTLFCLLDDSDQFKVKFKSGNSINNITVPASKFSAQESDFGSNKHMEQVNFTYIESQSIGVLKIASFAIPDMEQYFSQLDSIFSELKTNNIQNLILDLRDNSGGHPIFAAQLFSYLTDKEFVYFKRNEKIKEFEPLYKTMQPNKLNYSGNVYVFVNGGCLSTTGHLISLLKFHSNALFVGEAPGSTFRCNDFSMQVTLPNTGIKVNVPRTTFETAVSGFTLCEPFHIDYQISEKAIELVKGKDVFLEQVKSLGKM